MEFGLEGSVLGSERAPGSFLKQSVKALRQSVPYHRSQFESPLLIGVESAWWYTRGPQPE